MSIFDQHRRQLLAQLDLWQTQIDEVQAYIAQCAQYDPRVTRLMQIPGVGFYTAFAALAAIGDIQRFPSPKHLASYAGLVPSLYQSGQRNFSGNITKTGRSHLRWLMVEAAHIAVRWDPYWRAVFEHMAKRRGRSVAVVAVARKLLVVIWHLLTKEAPYHYLNPTSFIRKLKEWARVIDREALVVDTPREFVTYQLKVTNLQEVVLEAY